MSDDTRDELEAKNVRAVRVGHGANCSSIGSVIDTLFATAAVGSAVFAAVLAAMKNERVQVVEPGGDRGDGSSPVGGGARGEPPPLDGTE